MSSSNPLNTADRKVSVDLYRLAAQLPADAMALMEKHGQYSLQLGLPWFAILEKTILDGRPGLCYFVLRHSDCAVAVLPTVTANRGWGHRVQGLHRVYDLHRYIEERFDALKRWEIQLLGIVEPRPANVVPFDKAAT